MVQITSLWGTDQTIQIPQADVGKILKKVRKPKKLTETKVVKSAELSIKDKLEHIKTEVLRILGKYVDDTVVLDSKEALHRYIDKALDNGVIAIDTETNHSLDPLTCVLMGGCIYTPGEKNAYIPVNHVDLETNLRLRNQVSEEDICAEFSRLNGIKIITHNGKFDYQVLKCTTSWEMPITWDTMLGAKLLNTTEKAGLKYQYITKIDSSIEKYSIESFFENIPYELVPPELFALYAATDAYMTYKLYLYQLKEFNKPQHAGLLNVMTTIEVPVIIPVAEMELNGVSIDRDYAKRLSTKYHKKLDEVEHQIDEELGKLLPQIASWRLTSEANYKPPKKTGSGEGKSKNEQLNDPPKLTSPTQLAIVLYDVLHVDPVDKKNPRGTGEDILAKIKTPLCKLILEQRGLLKLINTYIDKIPNCTNPVDDKIHANFNQYGAETGRFSSSEPNLQNIPSHDKSIRMMFQASPGCIMLGGDFSAQEPKLLATYSQDPTMIKAFLDEKDLYAIIAEKVYGNSYEDNLQTHPDGSSFPEGKARRSTCKSILLGLMYGRGVASVAEQIGKPVKEAQEIFDKFYQDFPEVKKWIEDTQIFAKQHGYVEDIWGRRRHLPDIQLPDHTIRFTSKYQSNSSEFNPLLFSAYARQVIEKNPILAKYENLYEKCRTREAKDKLKKEALIEGVEILNNQGFIAEAERQSVNARIQGGAASMSKKAMIAIYNDPIMNQLGFKLQIMVHDELIGECPIKNQQAAMERLSYLMSEAGKPEVDLPMKCDVVAFSHWYLDEYTDMIREEFDKYRTKEMPISDILKKLCEEHSESTLNDLKNILEIS